MAERAEDKHATRVEDLRRVRARRAEMRRSVELRRLRAQQGGPSEGLADAESELTRLTEELIGMYRADLSLVDSVLDPTYPATVEGRGTP